MSTTEVPKCRKTPSGACPALHARAEAVRRFNASTPSASASQRPPHVEQPVAHAGPRALRTGDRKDTTATVLAKELGVDQGYMSRILAASSAPGI